MTGQLPPIDPNGVPAATSGDDGRVRGSGRDRLAVWSGAVLALSYPVLALSTGVRAGYQLFLKEGTGPMFGPMSTAVAALCYLAATVGFAVRRRWAWVLSVLVLSFELLMVIVVGTVSVLAPDRVGSSVWRLYGVDYGFFPLVQPILGLLWLLWPLTMSRYGVRQTVQHAVDQRFLTPP